MYDVEKEIIRTPVLLLRLVRLVVVVVGYECIMNVLAWFSPLGHPAPQGRTYPQLDTGWALVPPARTPSSTTHARQVRTQVRYRFATGSLHKFATGMHCAGFARARSPTHHGLGRPRGFARETRETAGAPDVRSAAD